MSDNGDLREDLKIPDGELGTQLRSEYDAGKELLVCTLFFFSWTVTNVFFFSGEFLTLVNNL